VLFDLANEVNRSQSVTAAAELKTLAGVLGLLQCDPQEFRQGRGASMHLTSPIPTLEASGGALDIDALIEARAAAKKVKNFAEADRIRKELLEAGIVLEDTPQGTTWRRT
jgi:cysteinyl-tRNA synthetase